MNIHEKVSKTIYSLLCEKVKNKSKVYVITICGESGCGKTETGKALVNEFQKNGVLAILLGQDNYFFYPPLENDAMRKKDAEWLGPHKEVNLELLNRHLLNAKNGANTISVPHINYDLNSRTTVPINIEGIEVIIVEGTYTSFLKYVDTKIFIDEDYKETLKYRKLRNRGNEVNDPFVENILETEHKIIAGHKYLADLIITKDYDVISTDESILFLEDCESEK